MIDRNCFRQKFGIFNFFKWIHYKFKFYKDNPNYFNADGLVCFVGPQGSGKTLCAVNYVYNLLSQYPKLHVVTNLDLTDFPFDGDRVHFFKNNDDLKKFSNGIYGVVFLIDEIQLYFNSLQSKNINMDVMVQISQQRKQRKHIVCTSQVFGRMAKPLREQFSCVVVCKNYFGFLQKASVVDRDSLDENASDSMELRGKILFNNWFIHSPEMYKRYDTYKIIKSNNFASGEKMMERSISYGS